MSAAGCNLRNNGHATAELGITCRLLSTRARRHHMHCDTAFGHAPSSASHICVHVRRPFAPVSRLRACLRTRPNDAHQNTHQKTPVRHIRFSSEAPTRELHLPLSHSLPRRWRHASVVYTSTAMRVFSRVLRGSCGGVQGRSHSWGSAEWWTGCACGTSGEGVTPVCWLG
jgi:hypothetical protein